MPFIPLRFKPGINRDQTNYTGEGGWWECDKVRFLSGLPQKLGGWIKYTPTAFIGVCRQMFNWFTSFSDNFLALGTNLKVYIEQGGNFSDITPLRATFSTPDTDDCLTFTFNSNVVVVAIDGHGGNDGDYVTLSGIAAGSVPGELAGIPLTELEGTEPITVINVNAFSITVDTPAIFGNGWSVGTWSSGAWSVGTFGSTLTGGGNTIVAAFDIEPGFATQTAGYGWGTSPWGGGSTTSWGLGSQNPTYLPQRDWWFDNFDNDLVMNIRDGGIYYWQRGTSADPGTALATRAVSLVDLTNTEGYDDTKVPVKAMQILVSQNDKHLVTFGSVPYGSTDPLDFDPLLIRWASQDNPFEWTISATTTAGFLRVSRGSYIVRALTTRQEVLVFTNSNLYSFQFLGTTDVFSLQELGDNLSIIGPRACISANNVTYWMGQDKFYAYSGRVETLPCTLRNHVFQNLNYQQADQIICGTNEGWNEIWWFYPSAQSNWNDSYVVYNHLEKIWYYGTIERTAWLDTALRNYPQACTTGQNSTAGYLYNHEDGVNDDTLPMTAYIQSNDFDISDGEQFMLTRRMIPDIGFGQSTAATPEATFQVRPRRFPGSGFSGDPADSQPIVETSVGLYTDQVFVRARARQMALKVTSQNLGVQWQLGTPRLDARVDGKR
jgi:hypothetical protein